MNQPWWKEGVVYQVYPRSYYDSNADGVGDLKGILKKLDYIKSLGVDVIWLNPIYDSPNLDNGYDISDYRSLLKEFGTLDEFKVLLKACHNRGLRLIMDLVVNHSSDLHPWFIESRSSKENDKRDYYIWRSSKGGEKPNNWKACFGGDAWELDTVTGEYYLHLFTPQQPDLNWDHKPLRREIYDMMNWWLDMGIDGFRMDVITYISKPEDLKDIAEGTGFRNGPYVNGPRQHEFLQEMYREVLAGRDIFTVGECPGIPSERALDFAGEERNELSMLFQFDHTTVDRDNSNKWIGKSFSLSAYRDILERWYKALYRGGWNCNYLMNHDQPRSVSRYGDDGEYRVRSAKMILTHLLTLWGTPYIYQGEELGLINPGFDRIEDYRDIDTLNYWNSLSSDEEREEGMRMIKRFSRDNSRTPMPWSPDSCGGFTTAAKPWIPVNPDYREVNVQAAEGDPHSVLHYFRALTALRKAHKETLVYGCFSPVTEEIENWGERLLCYKRESENEILLVICNFSGETVRLSRDLSEGGCCLLSNCGSPDSVSIQPWESSLWDVNKSKF